MTPNPPARISYAEFVEAPGLALALAACANPVEVGPPSGCKAPVVLVTAARYRLLEALAWLCCLPAGSQPGTADAARMAPPAGSPEPR